MDVRRVLSWRGAPVAPVIAIGPDGERVICARCVIASAPLRRVRGLMWKRELASDEGLLCRPAGSIHTFFMRFAIDAVFVDRGDRVVKIVAGLRPGRVAGARHARAVLELPAGRAAESGVRVGDRLIVR